MKTLLQELQRIVNRASREIFGQLSIHQVKPFGSRKYGAAGPDSDWDFYLELSAQEAPMAKVLRACIQKDLVEANITTWNKSEDQTKKNTLVWTTTSKMKVSINVSKKGDIHKGLQATTFLEQFFQESPNLLTVAMRVAEHLRRNKHMSTDGSAGDTLKSAVFFLLCVDLSLSRGPYNT